MEPRLTLIVARGRNGVIGRDGALPWRLSSDLRAFRAATLGKPVLMGRKTWESLGRPLPGRANLVLTRDPSRMCAGALAFSDLDAMLAAGRAIALACGADAVFVIGGGALYAATLARADRLIVTEVDAVPDGDAVFPGFEEACWRETERSAYAAGANDDHDFVIRTLDRAA